MDHRELEIGAREGESDWDRQRGGAASEWMQEKWAATSSKSSSQINLCETISSRQWPRRSGIIVHKCICVALMYTHKVRRDIPSFILRKTLNCIRRYPSLSSQPHTRTYMHLQTGDESVMRLTVSIERTLNAAHGNYKFITSIRSLSFFWLSLLRPLPVAFLRIVKMQFLKKSRAMAGWLNSGCCCCCWLAHCQPVSLQNAIAFHSNVYATNSACKEIEEK